jgi:L-seryl-tRNA(Ser) seleniumtransferase
MAAGREVIVSRGELVEIGGSFRIPDVLRASGARLVEVGTTNRTHAADYERAITSETAVLLKVHQSNFAMVGFTKAVPVDELAAIGRKRGIPTVVDLGSGSLLGPSELGVGPELDEPTVKQTVAAGADVVTFSGDKLLGGPQAGIVLGRAERLSVMRSHPLLRALRPSKLVLAGLEATLELYRDGAAPREVPTLAMLTAKEPILRARAARLAGKITAVAPWLEVYVIPVKGAVGGGALPLVEPPSVAVAVRHQSRGPDALEAELRRAEPPLIARIEDGTLICDVRTLDDEELDEAAAAFAATRPEA